MNPTGPDAADSAGAPGAPTRRLSRRAAVMLLVVSAVLVANLARVVQLKLAPHPELLAAAGTRESSVKELALRGEVVDRRGRVLATSVVGHRLFVDPALIWERGWEQVKRGQRADPDSPIDADPFADAARALAFAIGGDADRILSALRANADRRYLVLADPLEEWQLDSVRELNLPGVGVEAHPVREYPMDALAARIVGAVSRDQSGITGIERLSNRDLAPQDGRITFLRNVRRAPMWIERDGYRPAADGDSIRLTIDAMIQEIAERRLDEAVKKYNAAGGRVVIVDVETGDILAMADCLRRRPGFKEVTQPDDRERKASLGRNRCLTDSFEPGSTFKPFVWAWATMLGVYKPESMVPLPAGGPHRTSFGRLIRDVKYYGPNTWRFVLVKSLNAGMAIAAEKMKFKDMQACLRSFGFGRRLGLDPVMEAEGIVTSPKAWRVTTQTSVCMGHEVAVTPVQMAHAFTAFCRDGTMAPLRLVLPTDEAAALDADRPVDGVRVIPESIALLTREVMGDVMVEGTGRRAQSALYRIFGKTGTAQLPRPNGKGYYEDRYVANFLGGAPLTQPRIAVCAVIDDPDKRRAHFGGETAAPMARDIIDETLQYLGVPADQDPKKGDAIRALASTAGH